MNENIFYTHFGHLNIFEWQKIIIKSINENIIDGVNFPKFPSMDTQSKIHGYINSNAVIEAINFYVFIKEKGLLNQKYLNQKDRFLLDFGSGWGRIPIIFLRDFELKNIHGYEPNSEFYTLAKDLNPYINFIHGSYLPSNNLAHKLYDLIVGYSVFSHLSQTCIQNWLYEFERITKPGGHIVLTTYGNRFLEKLIEDKNNMDQGKEIDWHIKDCIQAIGDIDEKMQIFNDKGFIWIGDINSLYGTTFINEKYLQKALEEFAPKLKLQAFDDKTLIQDVFILKNCS